MGAPERIMCLPCVCACVCGGGVVLLRGSVFAWGLLLFFVVVAVAVFCGVRCFFAQGGALWIVLVELRLLRVSVAGSVEFWGS